MSLNIREKPVFAVLATFLVIIFGLYSKGMVKLPCENTILQMLFRHFVHLNIVHLASNLLAFYYLSSWESKIGTKRFTAVLFSIWIIATLLDMILMKLFPQLKCGVGFSGIVIGLLSWEMVVLRGLNIDVIIAALVTASVPSLVQKNISWKGHITGAIAGLIVSKIYTPVTCKMSLTSNDVKSSVKTSMTALIQQIPYLVLSNMQSGQLNHLVK